jgi:hypothetical protein
VSYYALHGTEDKLRAALHTLQTTLPASDSITFEH